MTKNIMRYKGYWSKVEYSDEDQLFFGTVCGIKDCIIFQGETVNELRKDFEESIDEYLEFCKTENKEPDKPYKGSFNVRISPDLHRQAAILAIEKDISLNELVSNAIDAYLNKRFEKSIKVVTSINLKTNPVQHTVWNLQDRLNFNRKELRI